MRLNDSCSFGIELWHQFQLFDFLTGIISKNATFMDLIEMLFDQLFTHTLGINHSDIIQLVSLHIHKFIKNSIYYYINLPDSYSCCIFLFLR